MAYLIETLDSATYSTTRKSKELSTDLKKQITDLNKSGKSLGAISKQLQVPRLTCGNNLSIKCMAQLWHCQDQDASYVI